MNYDFGYDLKEGGSVDTAASPLGFSQAQPKQQMEPSMLDNLKSRRQQLLTELRDTEQAIEALEANPSFAAVMKTVIRAHRY